MNDGHVPLNRPPSPNTAPHSPPPVVPTPSSYNNDYWGGGGVRGVDGVSGNGGVRSGDGGGGEGWVNQGGVEGYSASYSPGVQTGEESGHRYTGHQATMFSPGLDNDCCLPPASFFLCCCPLQLGLFVISTLFLIMGCLSFVEILSFFATSLNWRLILISALLLVRGGCETAFAVYTWKAASSLENGAHHIRKCMFLLLISFLTFASLVCYTMIMAAANKEFDEKELDIFLMIYGATLAVGVFACLYVYYILWSFAIQVQNGEVSLVTLGLRSDQLNRVAPQQRPPTSRAGDIERQLLSPQYPQPPVYEPTPTYGYNDYQNSSQQRPAATQGHFAQGRVAPGQGNPQPLRPSWEPYTPPRTPISHSPRVGPQ
eukprot:GHVN01047728.1.p1 GENE.GHVN01047728.1~~GHVN01047728.1.p1  ORF type:complete len:372 (+),score=38.40 GHVN01047728.1:98-1213(+)